VVSEERLMSTSTREAIYMSTDSNVGGSAYEETLLPASAIPVGTIARIVRFGGTDVPKGDAKGVVIALFWGSGGTWQLVRAAGLMGNVVDFEINRDFVGDGTKQFKVRRQNLSTSAKPIPVWLEGFKIET
jgi:hypothetical protein